jgi:hypothetical protein
MPILTVLAGMLAGFYAIIKFILSNASNTTSEDRKERQKLIETFDRVAEATERQAKEAEQRNGHLAEISIQNKDAILKAIDGLKLNQQVTEQTVEHQVVREKE